MLSISRIRDKELHTNPHHHKDDLGREGKYRRTSSPTICSTPNVRPSNSNHANSNHSNSNQANSTPTPSQIQKSQIKSPARTPKRDSPATIAAKGNICTKFQNFYMLKVLKMLLFQDSKFSRFRVSNFKMTQFSNISKIYKLSEILIFQRI